MLKEIQDFERQMLKAIKEIEGKSESVVKKAAIEAFSNVIDDTPVGDPTSWAIPAGPGYIPGTLKANWQIAIGNAPSSFLSGARDSSGSATKANVKAVVGAWKSTYDLYFVNNAPYAEQIEFGYSKQAPTGMFRNNIANFDKLVDKYAAQEDK